MAEGQKAAPEKRRDSPEEKKLPICGLMMPISGTDDPRYSRQHWESVRDILERAAQAAGFEPRMVSESDPTSIIQGNIVNNLYYDAITVCDVSSKNPNVMFELGMRLAFDKPVVIVKDDNTDYTFDIGIIQHVSYPCQLEYHSILKFIKDLSEKVKATYQEYERSPGEHGFLRHFGDIKPQHLTAKDVDTKELLVKLNGSVLQLSNSFLQIRRDIISQQEREANRQTFIMNRLNERLGGDEFIKRNPITKTIRQNDSDDDLPF